jgi:hypothetical protein
MSPDRIPGSWKRHEEQGVVWELFLVLMLGVGLGSAAAAWATRRPETVVRAEGRALVFEGDPTPEQTEQFRELLERLTAKDPYTTPVDSAPAQ